MLNSLGGVRAKPLSREEPKPTNNTKATTKTKYCRRDIETVEVLMMPKKKEQAKYPVN